MVWVTVSSRSFFFPDCIEFLLFNCKQYNQSGFGIDYLVMSKCRVISCVVGRGCFLWSMCSLHRILLAFHFSSVQLLSHVQFLQPHGLQHTSLLCPSPTPGACSNSCPSIKWCHPVISSHIDCFFRNHMFPHAHKLTLYCSSIKGVHRILETPWFHPISCCILPTTSAMPEYLWSPLRDMLFLPHDVPHITSACPICLMNRIKPTHLTTTIRSPQDLFSFSPHIYRFVSFLSFITPLYMVFIKG